MQTYASESVLVRVRPPSYYAVPPTGLQPNWCPPSRRYGSGCTGSPTDGEPPCAYRVHSTFSPSFSPLTRLLKMQVANGIPLLGWDTKTGYRMEGSREEEVRGGGAWRRCDSMIYEAVALRGLRCPPRPAGPTTPRPVRFGFLRCNPDHGRSEAPPLYNKFSGSRFCRCCLSLFDDNFPGP